MSSNHEIKMWTPTTVVMVLFALIATAIAVYRIVNGLGAATNMNDGYPWGIWAGFDLYGGVAMAGGASTSLTGKNTNQSAVRPYSQLFLDICWPLLPYFSISVIPFVSGILR